MDTHRSRPQQLFAYAVAAVVAVVQITSIVVVFVAAGSSPQATAQERSHPAVVAQLPGCARGQESPLERWKRRIAAALADAVAVGRTNQTGSSRVLPIVRRPAPIAQAYLRRSR
jgi:hypothetical protein